MAKQPVRRYERLRTYEEIENLEDYEPGGYHPIDLFDVLDGRFEVVYKLGFGGIAMVWLCYETDAKRWRAIKINAASHSSDDCAELKILKAMKEKSITPEQLFAMHVVVPWEVFWIDGPNGRHLCSVMPVLGPSLSKWRDDLGIDYDTIDKMSYQFTEGLAFLHKMDIAHGDFRPANILTKLKPGSLDDITVDEMKDLLDAPYFEEVLTTDGERSIHAPEDVVTAVHWHRLKHLISGDVAIVDFGESYLASNPPPTMGIPRVYGAPEILFGGTPTILSDIWSLAYALMEFRLGNSFISSIPAIIWRMEGYSGPVPPEYRSAAMKLIEESRGEPLPFHNEVHSNLDDQSLRPITEDMESLNAIRKKSAEGTDFTCPLEITLGARIWVNLPPTTDEDGLEQSGESGYRRLPPDEVTLFADLLRGMFKYNPEDRSSASQALNHNWMRRKQQRQETMVANIFGSLRSIIFVGLSLSIPLLAWSLCKIYGLYNPTIMHKVPYRNGVDICFITAIGGF